jgi:putative oligomerization/nucleic acid binding protein
MTPVDRYLMLLDHGQLAAKETPMPLFRRRPLLRAAAVGGGAYMMGKRRGEEQQEAPMQGQQSMTAAPAAAPSSGISSEDTVRLQELGKLHEQGILTDEEFAQQKARILGGP